MRKGRRSAPSSVRAGSKPARERSPASIGRSDALLYAALVILFTIVYHPALHGGFFFDDLTFIADNPLIRAGDGWWRIWLMPRASSEVWPLSFSVHWIEWHLWGANPFGYHVVNILVHALNVLLVARVLRRLEAPGALPAALIFGLHPIDVEAVAWIAQLKTLLSFTFSLAALLAYTKSMDRRFGRSGAAALLLFALGLMAKTSVAPLPAVLLGLHAWRGETHWKRAALRLLPFFALAIAGALASTWFERHGARPEDFALHLSWPERWIVAGRAFWFYLGRIALPSPGTIVYPQWTLGAGTFGAFVPLALAALLGIALLVFRNRSWGRPSLACLGYYSLMIAPVLGLVDIAYMRYSFVADHWAYPAVPGIVALAVSGACALGRQIVPARSRLVTGRAAAAAVMALCGGLSWWAARPYRDPEVLWLETLRRNPGAWVAHYDLAVDYHRQGRLEAAVDHYVRAIALKPDYARAEYNLGAALNELGHPDQAIPHFERALAIRPNYGRAWTGLGQALEREGRASEAAECYRRARSLATQDR